MIPVLAVLLSMPVVSCNDDNPAKPKSPYKSLAADQPRDDALLNLQYSCNERNLARYEELLDEGFVFYFSAEDVLNGTPENWARAAEVAAVANLFSPNYANPNQEPAQEIDVMLYYAAGDTEWTEVEPEDPVTYPGETWCQKIVTYTITVQLPGDFQYMGLNKQAAFVLRAATVESEQVWRIVVWKDDTGAGFSGRARGGAGTPAVEQVTWGGIKMLYSD